MSDEAKAKSLIQRHEQLKSERYAYEKNWQDIIDLVRTGTSDFTRSFSPSQTRTENIFDGTAPQALEELASGLHSHLTSSGELWFALEVEDMESLENDADALLWLEEVSNRIYEEFSNPVSNFNASLNENYMDLGAFGTCVLNQEWNPGTRHLNFRAFPLADCWIEENAHGKVDSLDREAQMTKRQMTQMFGEEALPQKVRDDTSPNKKFPVIHSVYPRADRNTQSYASTSMKYASCWVCKEPADILKESGYNSFPYHVPRWTKLASEVYGRGPALKCLPDIRMLNRMEFTIIKAAQKIVDPPLQAVNDGFIGQIRTGPGSIIYREPGVEELTALETKANIPIGLEMSDQRRNFIRKCFYADWLRLKDKKAEQTAYEIQEMVDEQLRMMEPMFGRLEGELLGPLIARAYELMQENDQIPLAPPVLQKRKLKVRYVSPAARAQRGRRAIGIRRYFETVVPFAQVKPDVMDGIDFDGAMQELAVDQGVSRKAVRSPEAIAAIRKDRADKENLALAAQVAEPMSNAIKNVAQAQQVKAA